MVKSKATQPYGFKNLDEKEKDHIFNETFNENLRLKK